jgi:putative transposase
MYTQSEKMEIIRLVENSEWPVKRTLKALGVPRSTFYAWYKRYQEEGFDGLARRTATRPVWNKIPEEERQQVVDVALEHPDKSPRQLAYYIIDQHETFVSESSVYRILKARDLITSPVFQIVTAASEFKHKTKRINQLWQTDFTQLKVIGWGWYYLCTILDDYSRYILAWRLAPTMGAEDAKATLLQAVEFTGVSQIRVRFRPRLLSDNGSAFISENLATFLKQYKLAHTRGAPYHPQTQGKIERWHRSMKNIVKLDLYFYPWELEQALGSYVDYYNQQRYHESLDNLTPADVYFGRREEVLSRRELIKQMTLKKRWQVNCQTPQSMLLL